jgi:hypothetical protein
MAAAGRPRKIAFLGQRYDQLHLSQLDFGWHVPNVKADSRLVQCLFEQRYAVFGMVRRKILRLITL